MGDPKAALFRIEEKEVEEKTERSKFLTMIPVILGKRNFLLLYTIHFHVNLPNKYITPNHTNTLKQQEIWIKIYIAFCWFCSQTYPFQYANILNLFFMSLPSFLPFFLPYFFNFLSSCYHTYLWTFIVSSLGEYSILWDVVSPIYWFYNFFPLQNDVNSEWKFLLFTNKIIY